MGIFDIFNHKKLTDNRLNPVVLLVLDGWGMAPPSAGNPMARAKTPNINSYWKSFPHAELIASGESVGLPANEVGNTEVGHLNLGAGRTVYQGLKRIDMAIERGDFFETPAFWAATKHVKDCQSKLHIIGLVSSGNVHSSLNHFFALARFAKKSGVAVFYHLFVDGRDAPPKEAIDLLAKVEGILRTEELGKIATISGRYYAMDRDHRWERTQKAYEAIVEGIGQTAETPSKAIEKAYANGQTDEFVEPTVITYDNQPIATVDDNDAVIFFNFRIDRPRQLTMAFVAHDFRALAAKWGFDPYEVKYSHKHGAGAGSLHLKDPFTRNKVARNLFFVTMTEYQKDLPVSAVAFPPEPVNKCLPQVLSEGGFKQMHMAESEKERFVTYYFDGLREERVSGEDVLIVPSPKVATYDKKPEMSVFELTNKFREQLARGVYKFFIINFANPDMVAHTGNIAATIKALEATDLAVGRIVEVALSVNGTVVLTADHGNAEELLTYEQTSYFFTSTEGEVNTDHSNSPVPFILISNSLRGKAITLPKGALPDVAPTILSLIGIPAPHEMTGRNLAEGVQSGKLK